MTRRSHAISKRGFKLLSDDAKNTLIEKLIPIATLITPNLPEAEELLGREILTIEDMKKAACDLKKLGAKNVLIQGGHLEGEATDILYDGENFTPVLNVDDNTKAISNDAFPVTKARYVRLNIFMVNYRCAVYNGRFFIPLNIKLNMHNYLFSSFVFTKVIDVKRLPRKYEFKKKKKKDNIKKKKKFLIL